MCSEDEGCKDIVKSAWRKAFLGRPIDQVEGKIKNCQIKLNWWSRGSFLEYNLGFERKERSTSAG